MTYIPTLTMLVAQSSLLFARCYWMRWIEVYTSTLTFNIKRQTHRQWFIFMAFYTLLYFIKLHVSLSCFFFFSFLFYPLRPYDVTCIFSHFFTGLLCVIFTSTSRIFTYSTISTTQDFHFSVAIRYTFCAFKFLIQFFFLCSFPFASYLILIFSHFYVVVGGFFFLPVFGL